MIKDWVSTAELNSIGISYKKADVNTRGKFSLSPDRQLMLLQKAKDQNINGLFLLSTCNRTEIIGFTKPETMKSLLCEFSMGEAHELDDICTVRSGKKSVKHLFKVGTGLESQILGDYEIVGQMKTAFKLAKESGALNPYLERLLNQVLKASKMVKNKTDLSSGTTSVSYAAVQYIMNNIEAYSDKSILVYGLGKMGRNTCKNIIKYTTNRNTSLINRTLEKAVVFVSDHPEIRLTKSHE
jgi:glutamyl-tRNA reductase